jgi:hypothetical protein
MSSVFVIVGQIYGEVSMEIYTGFSSIENYLLNEGYSLGTDEERVHDSIDSYKDSVYELIRYAVDKGRRKVADKDGWGVVSIVELEVDELKCINKF